MSSGKDTGNPRKPSRERSTPTKKSSGAGREPRGRAVARRQIVGSTAHDEHEQGASTVDTLQKVITRRTRQDQPPAGWTNPGKEPGVFSAALAHKDMEEAQQRDIGEEKGSRARVATKKRQKAQVDTRRGRPGEATARAGRKKSGQPQRSPAKPQAEKNKAIPEGIAGACPEVSRKQFAQPLKKCKQSLTSLADKALSYALERWTRAREAVGTHRKSPACRPDDQPIAPVAPPQHELASLQTTTVQHSNPPQFLQVRYQNTKEGRVDDLTLDELIESKRISHFFRPSEHKWVDVSAEPVRDRARTNATGLWRRASDCERKVEKEEKPHDLFSGRFRRHTHRSPPKTELTPQECFQQGFVAFHTTDDCEAAIRAFARSIQLDPTFERAYVHRGLAYEKFGNVQQAVEDYSRALLLNPSDGKLYYLRGLSFRRLGMDAEATEDLRTASGLNYWPAYNLLKSTKI